jgi:hypothetical protein
MDNFNTFFSQHFGFVSQGTQEEKRQIFNELVSLFDSLHDFGRFGSVHDYVTKNGETYITWKKTVFNHLRNGYSRLKGLNSISRTNSHLHCYNDAFHLKVSVSSANLENIFLEFAKRHLLEPERVLERTDANLTEEDLRRFFGNTLIFSVDTQKKLFSGIQRLNLTNAYQTYDREKRCDPASHTSTDIPNIMILREKDFSRRRIYNPSGVESAIISGNTVETSRIRINLEGSPGEQIKMDALSSRHKNNVTNVNNNLKTLVNNEPAISAQNVSVVPSARFYEDEGGIGLYRENNSPYILNLRRKLAQKRLGDQLQVHSCQKKIIYKRNFDQLSYQVQYPIFVSIDRMAIAYAISLGVNCIYSNGNNLILFKGSETTKMTNIIKREREEEGEEDEDTEMEEEEREVEEREVEGQEVEGQEVEVPLGKKPKIGGYREDWQSLYDNIEYVIDTEPDILIDIFLSSYQRHNMAAMRNRFRNVLANTNYVSSVINDSGNDIVTFNGTPYGYIIRSYTNNDDNTIAIDIPSEGSGLRNCLVYFRSGGNKWYIRRDAMGKYTLQDETQYISFYLQEIAGFLSENEGVEWEALRGGGNTENDTFLLTLAKYDLVSFFDVEQRKIWYDEFYVTKNGKAFMSPTFYELNAFFKELFQTNINYNLIFPFLKNSRHAFSKQVLYGLERILEYMNIPHDFFPKTLDAHTKTVLNGVLERSNELSNTYSKSFSSLNSHELLDYIYENDLSPLYFYRAYDERKSKKEHSRGESINKAEKVYNSKKLHKTKNKRRLVSRVIGGRNRFKKSPRRKTLRKTRKLK